MIKGRGTGKVCYQKLKSLPGPLLIIFMLLSAAISVSGYFYYQKQKKNVYREQTVHLQAFADLKANEISQWLNERLGNASQIMENRILAAELLAYISDHHTGRNQESIRIWMESLQKNYHYQNIILLNRSGKPVFALKDHDIGPKELRAMEAIRQRKQAIISDLYFLTKTTSSPLLDVLAPLMAADTISGFVILRIDPGQYLFPMIQSWPTPSPSAETLLVRREGDEVVFLNELRHRRNSALKLRFPLKTENLPAVQAVLGRQGIFSGTDYRGIPVWSVVRPVQNSPWFIVAKIDREEIEQPIRRSIMGIFLVALSLILATAMVILFLWQRQGNRFLKSQFEAESQKQALVHHFDYLSRYANDIILLCNENGNILEANERAIITYGYGRDALLKMNLQNLRAPKERDKLAEQMQKAEKELGLIFETLHRRKDGSVFPVEVSARTIVSNGKKYFQNIVRDITERKRVERELQSISARNQALLEAIPDIIMEVDVNKVYTWANHAGIDFFGSDVIGNEAADYFEGEQHTYQKVQSIFAGQEDVIYIESWQRRHDGEKRLLAWWCRVLKDGSNDVKGALSSARDITESRKAEEQIRISLKEKEVLLQEIHHRVKNNLQIISGLLALQAEQDTGKPLNAIFQESHDRIRSIALIHEKLIHSNNLAEIDFSQYLRNLSENLLNTYFNVTGRVNTQFDTEQVFLSIETAIPLGLIINELVTNCLKHAFNDGRQGEIYIALHGVQRTDTVCHTPTYELTVADNGIGLPAGFKIETQKSLGMHLVSMLVKQLQAELQIGHETGTRFSISFSISKEIDKGES